MRERLAENEAAILWFPVLSLLRQRSEALPTAARVEVSKLIRAVL